MNRFAFATLLLLGGFVSSRAAVFQVPGDHSTLLAAADAAVEGDSILVAPGTYTDRETREINGERIRASAFLAPGVTIVGTGGAEATIVLGDAPEAGAINALIVPNGSGWAAAGVQGLTLRGGDPGVNGIDTRTWDRFALLVRDCVLEECGAAAHHTAQGGFRLESTLVRDHDGTADPTIAVVHARFARFEAEDCTFRDNRGRLLYVNSTIASNTTTVIGCSFLRNSEGETLHAVDQPVTVEGCRFVDNVVEGPGAAILQVGGSTTRIHGNLFLRNSSTYYVLAANRSPSHDIARNTFYGNHGDDGIVWCPESDSVEGNVFAESTRPALRGADRTSRGCNLYWNSAPYQDRILHGSDIVSIDPEFCEPLADDFRVAPTSPCLDENNFFDCEDIGAFGVGDCEGTGVPIHVIDAMGGEVTVDGVTEESPAMVAWVPGTAHSIQVDEVRHLSSWEREVFHSWSDGGAIAHDVVAPLSMTYYVASFDLEYLLQTLTRGAGSVIPETGWHPAGAIVPIEAIPDFGNEFIEWTGSAYSGTENPVPITMSRPRFQTAHFDTAYYDLAGSVGSGAGRVVPEAGTYEVFTPVTLRARAEKGWRFVEWKGQGEGSYTGRQNPITIEMVDDVEQVAHFEPVRFDLGLSLSRFSANVHEGGPVGFGEVYLWLTCASGRRVQEVEIRLHGTMDVLAFVPAPGMIAQGTNPVIVNTGFCRWSAARLGYFIVNDPDGGTLCLDTAGDDVSLQVTDCSGSAIPWPQQVSFIGISTAGGDACSTGTGCINQIETGPEAGDGTIVLAGPMRIGLNEVFPNPFTGETTIRYAVSRPQRVQVVVYDIAGRRVSVLRDAPADPGVSSIRWNGRDSAGSRVGSGVYFVRMQSEETTEARKIIRLSGR